MKKLHGLTIGELNKLARIVYSDGISITKLKGPNSESLLRKKLIKIENNKYVETVKGGRLIDLIDRE